MTKRKKPYLSTIYYSKTYASVGFTLVELLVTIILVGIIIAIATPSFISLLYRLEAKDIRNKITTAMRVAKVESFTRHQYVIMCLANANNLCHKNATDRLIVFTDTNNNQRYDNNQDILLSIQALDLDYGHTFLRASLGRHYIKFFGDTGRPRGHYGHIKYCPDLTTNPNKYLISLNQNGGIKFKPPVIQATDCPT
ncbi:pilus assembly FimT family protein [Psychrobacter sp. I-STPA10]|uniref:pilus assembly FimT family protein n=1 Tax=Psychrobacter sp. I-STPA10 TaxID=2585769 RepID=UPI001E428A3B|nr:GspH/FimT family pseudopilin [Psychrobacter sp. I-STPA10]